MTGSVMLADGDVGRGSSLQSPIFWELWRRADIRPGLKQLGSPISSNNVWVAALARQHSLPVSSDAIRFDAVEGVRRLTF